MNVEIAEGAAAPSGIAIDTVTQTVAAAIHGSNEEPEDQWSDFR